MIKEYAGKLYAERDISWLSFNERVLQEAADRRVPLLERLKFLAIFSSNMDEFFRVRVASLRRMMKVNHIPEPWHNNPSDVISEIQKIVLQQQVVSWQPRWETSERWPLNGSIKQAFE